MNKRAEILRIRVLPDSLAKLEIREESRPLTRVVLGNRNGYQGAQRGGTFEKLCRDDEETIHGYSHPSKDKCQVRLQDVCIVIGNTTLCSNRAP